MIHVVTKAIPIPTPLGNTTLQVLKDIEDEVNAFVQNPKATITATSVSTDIDTVAHLLYVTVLINYDLARR